MSRGKLSLIVVVLAFFIGTGYGVYVMVMDANDSIGTHMTVNESAFPVLNNTTTNTTIPKNTTKKPAKNNANSTTPPQNLTD